VEVQDAANYNGSSHFTLKVILMWCIHDFPTYGIMVGCVTKGYHACPICGLATLSHQSSALSIHVCNQHRQWLPMDHPFRENVVAFDGVHEVQLAPPKIKVDDIIQRGAMRQQFLHEGGHPRSNDPAKRYGIKQVPKFFELEYWKVHTRETQILLE
jgi:hypothetical protein